MNSLTKRLLLILALFVVLGGLAALGTYRYLLATLPKLITVEDYEPLLVSQVYDRNGKKIGEFFRERRFYGGLGHRRARPGDGVQRRKMLFEKTLDCLRHQLPFSIAPIHTDPVVGHRTNEQIVARISSNVPPDIGDAPLTLGVNRQRCVTAPTAAPA